MGRARIVSHIDEGQYNIKPVIAGIDSSPLVASQVTLEERIEVAVSNVESAESSVAAELAKLNEIIENGESEKIEEQNEILRNAESALEQSRAALALLNLELAGVEKRIEEAEQETDEAEEQPAWCADYSLELSGVVDTVEINGDPSRMILAPSGVAPIVPDISLQSANAQAAWQVFYNWAVYPGWQRWMPTYRVGQVERIFEEPEDSDEWFAEVRIDSADVSKAQDLPITPDELPDKYTFKYMDCDHQAFEAGDRVVVSWPKRDFSEGVIIGFESEPKPCYIIEHLALSFGNIATVWCPETETVVLPPCVIGSDQYKAWWERTKVSDELEDAYNIGTVEVTVFGEGENPNHYYRHSVDERLPSEAEGCVNYADTPITEPKVLSDAPNDCTFTANANGLENTPHRVCADHVGLMSNRDTHDEGPLNVTYYAHDNREIYKLTQVADPDASPPIPAIWTDQACKEAYEVAWRQVWDYAHMGNFMLLWHTYEGTPEWDLLPANTVRLESEQGNIDIRAEFYQTREWNKYTDCDGEEIEREKVELSWTRHSLGGQTITGTQLATKEYVDEEPSIVFDYHTGGSGGYMRSEYAIYQWDWVQHGHYDNGTMGPVDFFVAATSDWLEDESGEGIAKETPAFDRPHNPAFATCVSDLWDAYRETLEIEADVPVNPSEVTTFTALFKYAADPARGEYPYVIEEEPAP